VIVCGTVPAVRRPVTAVLFDFAGTLFMPLAPEAWVAAAAAEAGVALGGDEVAVLADRCLRAGLPGGPYPAAIPDALVEVYDKRDLSAAAHRTAYVGLLSTVAGGYDGLAEALYAQVLRPEGWLPYRDALRVVTALADSGFKLGVVSNVGFDLRPVLRRHGFEALADNCTLSFEHGVAKPDAAIFREATRSVGADPSETLMVGDHPEADAAAAAIGCPTLLLPMSDPGGEHGLDGVLRLVA
jgi:HAD superfamily hydrolase (TIGR01509 family)